MSTIKGIFEPFYNYVTTQLNLRKAVVGEGTEGTSINESQQDISLDPNNYQIEASEAGADYTFGINEVEGTRSEGNIPLPEVKTLSSKKTRSKSFFAYTTQKQCTIRMASGVDIRLKNKILSEYETHLTGPELARNWVLEGGIKHQGMDRGGGLRSGLSEGANPSTAYGDWSIRSDAGDGFGIVPMPGIIDATIDTKSDNGSLREAKVNYLCHNRRQLEVLEALYMRPGYPVLLEWGWVPYISNDMTIEEDNPSILDDFMNHTESLTSLNLRISLNKEKTGGNYDGFIGYIKNFSFKATENGGYECVTEIIAHGEILESLKMPIQLAPRILSAADVEEMKGRKEGKIPTEYESIDRFLFYLRAIKTNLDAAGNKAVLNYIQTDREKKEGIYLMTQYDFDKRGGLNDNLGTIQQAGTVDSPFGHDAPKYVFTETGGDEGKQEVSDLEALIESSYLTGTEGDPLAKNEFKTQSGTKVAKSGIYHYYSYKTADGEDDIPIHLLNQIHPRYEDGFTNIEKLVQDISKMSDPELIRQKEGWESDKKLISGEEATAARSGTMRKHWFNSEEEDFIKHVEKASVLMRDLDTAGLDPILEGTILKEISVEDENSNDSGIRKKIFVRWDLICQILNKEVTPEYKKNHALVELTYLNPNQPTFKEGDGDMGYNDPHSYQKWRAPDGRKDNNYYLEYSTSNTKYGTIYQSGSMDGDKFQPDLSYMNFGQSFDRNVCLMPHQVKAMKKSGGEQSDMTINPLTSFFNTKASDTAIGMVYFNLDYLIQTYEELALETFTVDLNGVEKTKKRIKNKFSYHDWITTIWNGVNDACGGYYNFGLHTEHSRPHVARIIDFTFSGDKSDLKELGRDIFQFDPQGLGSISRESSYVSKIDNDFASTISIAAQAPNNIFSLEAMSFKAFHKDIKNRFTVSEEDQNAIGDYRASMEERYKNDVKQYNDALLSLNFYVFRMNQSNYETELVSAKENKYRKPMSPNVAKDMASRLEEMKMSIDGRHGEKENGRVNNNSNGEAQKGVPWVGTYREDTTFNRSAIIPITVSMTVDGIGGIHPLQIFKINPEKLPLGYQNKDIVFVVKKEAQSITSTQDWTTTLEGYLTLLNRNPNKSENTISYLDSNTYPQPSLSSLDNLEAPNADKLRDIMAGLNSTMFKLTEKQLPSEKVHGELSSGGDIDPKLVIQAEKLFKAIKEKYHGEGTNNNYPTQIEVTSGNDMFHHAQTEVSLHTAGMALDFTINTGLKFGRDSEFLKEIEEIITSLNINFTNEYENPSINSTGKHMHISIN